MRRSGLFLAMAMLAAGCGRRPAAPPAVTGPGTAQAAEPAPQLTIDGVVQAFPPVLLHIEPQTSHGGVTLYTGGRQPAGNNFYFDLAMDLPGDDSIDQAQWQITRAGNQRVDSLNGIVLDGGRREFQPGDVTFTFARRGDRIVVDISGRFLLFETPDSTVAARSVSVRGRVTATLERSN